MRSVSLSADNPGEGESLMQRLAGPRADEAFRRSEAFFARLPLEDRVEHVWKYAPRIFQLESISRCNLNCPLCSTHHLRRGYTTMPLEWVQGIVRDNPQMHYACLHLMGEPLLSESLFGLVKCLKAKGIYTYFASNGMLLEQKAREVVLSGLDKISISLDGMNQEDLARYRRGADLDRILRGIARLISERRAQGSPTPLIQIQTVMFPYNEVKEDQLLAFLKSLDVDRIKFKRPSFDTFGGRNDSTGGFRRAVGASTGRYSRQGRGYVMYRDRAVCRLLFQGFALSDGSVVPCCIDYDGRHAFGNLGEKDWREIWYSEERREVLRRFFGEGLEICRTCSLGYEYSTTVWERLAAWRP